MDAKAASVPPTEAMEPYSVTDVSREEEKFLQIQQQLAFLEEQNTAALKAMKLGMGRASSQHEVFATELSLEAGRLEQSIRDLDPVVALIQGDLATLRKEVNAKIANLHETTQVFADRLILLEVDISALAGRGTDCSMCVEQSQQQHTKLRTLAAPESPTTEEGTGTIEI